VNNFIFAASYILWIFHHQLNKFLISRPHLAKLFKVMGFIREECIMIAIENQAENDEGRRSITESPILWEIIETNPNSNKLKKYRKIGDDSDSELDPASSD
jgi:hypothetical protein